jgi:hypothetical protein
MLAWIISPLLRCSIDYQPVRVRFSICIFLLPLCTDDHTRPLCAGIVNSAREEESSSSGITAIQSADRMTKARAKGASAFGGINRSSLGLFLVFHMLRASYSSFSHKI